MSSPAAGEVAGPTVAVTGAASALGTAVVRSLLAQAGRGVGRVLALDTEQAWDASAHAPEPPVGAATAIRWAGPLDTPDVAHGLAGADVVVLLAPAVDLEATLRVPVAERRALVVRRTQAVVTATAAVGARRLVAVTSAMVLGARAGAPVPLPDDAPPDAPADTGEVGDLLEVEHVLARVPRSHPSLRLAVLRPAALVGPGVDTVVSRHFEAPRLLVLREAATVWQFCHLDDLADAVALTVTADLDGPLTVGAPEPLGQDEIEHISGMRRVELTEAMAMSTAERLHRIGVLPAPASDLAYVVRPWAVSAQRLLDAGWSPLHDNVTCLGVLLDQVRGHHAVASRRLDRKDAALGAAGAAVALVGTAAIVRRRRRKDG